MILYEGIPDYKQSVLDNDLFSVMCYLISYIQVCNEPKQQVIGCLACVSTTGNVSGGRREMAYRKIPIFLLFAIFQSVIPADKQTLRAFFTQNIVPDVIDSIPPSLLFVNYVFLEKNGTLDVPQVDLGNILTEAQTKEQPIRLSMEDVNPAKSYALIMIDVDPPTRQLPGLHEFLHWMVVNLHGNLTNLANEGDTLVKYYPPGPPPLTGFHRFVFLMFEQPYPTMHFDTRDYPGGSLYSRLRFNRATFTKKYNLGKPVAANFYNLRYG